MAEAEREEELARSGQLDEADLPLEEYDAQGRPLQTPIGAANDARANEALAAFAAALSALAAEPSVATTSTAATENSANSNIALSKEKFHQKQRSKNRRRSKRTLSNAAGEPGISKAGGASKRPLKGVALKRRNAANVLSSSIAPPEEIANTLATDTQSTATDGAIPIPTNFSLHMDDVNVASTAYVGKRDAKLKPDSIEIITGANIGQATAEDLVAHGFEYIAWDGRYESYTRVPWIKLKLARRECRPILDQSGRIFAVLAGRPQDSSWDSVNPQLQEIFETARDAYQLDAKQKDHRRGEFAAVACGISYGGGQQVCTLIKSLPGLANTINVRRKFATSS